MKTLITLFSLLCFSQLSLAQTPVSINAVLVPSDNACNSCVTGKPLYTNSFGVGIFPSDESCRKCETSIDKELASLRKKANQEILENYKKECIEYTDIYVNSGEIFEKIYAQCEQGSNLREHFDNVLKSSIKMSRRAVETCTRVLDVYPEARPLYKAANEYNKALVNVEEEYKNNSEYCAGK